MKNIRKTDGKSDYLGKKSLIMLTIPKEKS